MVTHLSQGTVAFLFSFFQFLVGLLNGFVHQRADLLDLVDRQRFQFVIGQSQVLHFGFKIIRQDIFTSWFFFLQQESWHQYICNTS